MTNLLTRRAFTAVLTAVLLTLKRGDGKGSSNMTPSDQLISKRLTEIEKSGQLAGTTIEIWSGGGQPPPYYKSDQLRLMPAPGGDVIEFASLRFDSHFDPPSVQDKWTIPADQVRVREAARLILSLKLLENHFPEERDPGIADIMSSEIIISSGETQVSRRYFRKMPAALQTLGDFTTQLIATTKKNSSPKLFHKGHEVK